jgi:thymidylate kinase
MPTATEVEPVEAGRKGTGLKLINLRQGFVVSFEGLDGVGKTTQLELARKWFEERTVAEIVVIRDEPFHGRIEEFAKFGIDTTDSDTLFFLYLAQSMSREADFAAFRSEKKIALVDRSIDTVVSYGLLMPDLRRQSGFYRQLNQLIHTYYQKPDLTLLFKAEKDTRRKRIEQRGEVVGDRFDEITWELEKSYRDLAMKDPTRIQSINSGVRTETQVAHEVSLNLNGLLRSFRGR